MKLFEEIRIDEKLAEPKKKYKRVKKDDDVDKPKVKYTLLREGNKDKVGEFIELYKEDPYKARVKFFNGNKNAYTFSRLVLFEYENGDFQICNFLIRFGISVTNRMYSTQKKVSSISYRNKKFWYKGIGGNVMPLGYNNFSEFVSSNEINILNFYDPKKQEEVLANSKIVQYFLERFHWFRVVLEYEHKYNITFNTIVSKKLFGIKDLNRHLFKVPYNISLILEKGDFINRVKRDSNGLSKFVALGVILKVLSHIDHLREEMVNDVYFYDTCKMAMTLGYKINCKWGLKRLRQEHDEWARLITQIELDCIKEFDLNIRPQYFAFEEYSGFKLLKTNKDMLVEGMFQEHCVGTYIDRVDRGECAIFHVDGYTLQLGISERVESIREMPDVSVFGNGNVVIPVTKNKFVRCFKNMQFKGKYNSKPPKELVEYVENMMKSFELSGGLDIDEETEEYKPNKSGRGVELNDIGVYELNNAELEDIGW